MAIRSKKKWSRKEEDFVLDQYGVTPAKEIAKRLGRTESGVRWKAGQLGVTGLNRVTATVVYNRNSTVEETKKPWWRFW